MWIKAGLSSTKESSLLQTKTEMLTSMSVKDQTQPERVTNVKSIEISNSAMAKLSPAPSAARTKMKQPASGCKEIEH